jgi:hypothetical protein
MKKFQGKRFTYKPSPEQVAEAIHECMIRHRRLRGNTLTIGWWPSISQIARVLKTSAYQVRTVMFEVHQVKPKKKRDEMKLRKADLTDEIMDKLTDK